MKILCVLSKFAYGKPERGENYDYVNFLPSFERLGHEVAFFDSGDRNSYRDFAGLNEALLKQVEEFRPDVIFCVLMHYEIWIETLDAIRQNSPAAIVSWGTDDSWKFKQVSRFFTRHVDLHVTTSPDVEQFAVSSGLSNVFLSQWAASSGNLSEPRSAKDCSYDVSFVGNLYGQRRAWISKLCDSGIRVACFGNGSEEGVIDARRIRGIYNDSKISLNFSGSGESAFKGQNSAERQIKARTFEVPGAGGFLLTESAPHLERYFIAGKEVTEFGTPEQLIGRVKHFLAHPAERDSIARAGFVRTRDEHTYEKRFALILDKLGSLQRNPNRKWSISANDLAQPSAEHRTGSAVRKLRNALIAPFVLVFGKERGVRAARRFLYEMSWRMFGEATYRARGLPGRLFYAES